MSEGAWVTIAVVFALAWGVRACADCEGRDRVEYERGHYVALTECLKRFTPKECAGL